MTIAKDVPITSDPEILRGTPVFAGTRVPVSAMLENLEAGVSLDEFLENFPTVTREQAVRVLEHFRAALGELDEQLNAANAVLTGDREALRKLARGTEHMP